MLGFRVRHCALNEARIRRTAAFAAFLFLLFQVSASAQTRFTDSMYADANPGLFVASYDLNLQLQGGLGYLITRQHGLGVSFRMEDAVLRTPPRQV